VCTYIKRDAHGLDVFNFKQQRGRTTDSNMFILLVLLVAAFPDLQRAHGPVLTWQVQLKTAFCGWFLLPQLSRCTMDDSKDSSLAAQLYAAAKVHTISHSS
jgi:hypothetical protein